MSLLLTSLVLIPVLAPLSPAPAPAATVIAYPAAQVTGANITLGDVARVECSDPAVTETLRSIDLGPAPLPGRDRPLDLSTLAIRLRQRGLSPERVSLQGPTRIQVTRAAQTLPGEQLVQAAADAALPRLRAAAAGEEVTLEPLRVPPPVVAALGALQIDVECGERALMGSTVTAMVSVKVDGARVALVPVQFRLRRLAQVVVADRLLERKATVAAECVRLEQRDLTTLAKDVARSLEEVVGLQLRVPVAPGQPVLRSSLEEPFTVEAKAEVTIVAAVGQVRVSAAGTALEAGRQGQTIRVLNKAANREVKAKVLDSQTVQADLGDTGGRG